VNLFGINVMTEGERGKNTNFSARVKTFNVGCRVFFGVTELLSKGKCV